MEDDKVSERCGEVKDVAIKRVKPRDMGQVLPKTVGKACKINQELGEFSLLIHIWGLLLY